MENQGIRSFIAVELPREVKFVLQRLQSEMKSAKHDFIKWAAPESIHITLKFLGNISPRKVTEITKAMKEASKDTSCFQLELTKLGAFPNLRQPRVIWLGIGGEVDKLIGLHQHIDDALTPLGFTRETRPFSPHLTLARLRERASPQARQDFGELIMKTSVEVNYKISVTSLSLMKSQLLPTGAVYSRLAEVKLESLVIK